LQREAQAFPSVSAGSIKVAGGIVQNGDPSYTYQLGVYAVVGAINIGPSASPPPAPQTTFELYGLVGVDNASVITDPDTATWGVMITPAGTVTEPSGTYSVSDVTLTLDSGYVAGAFGLAGLFTVTTDSEYSTTLPGSYPSFLTSGVSDSYNVSGFVSGPTSQPPTNVTLIEGGVPEPSTLVYALCAIASLPAIRLARKRRSRTRGLKTA
jgi:hypothetical protein